MRSYTEHKLTEPKRRKKKKTTEKQKATTVPLAAERLFSQLDELFIYCKMCIFMLLWQKQKQKTEKKTTSNGFSGVPRATYCSCQYFCHRLQPQSSSIFSLSLLCVCKLKEKTRFRIRRNETNEKLFRKIFS